MDDNGFYFCSYICIDAYPVQNSPTARVEITEIWLENEYTRLSNKAIMTSPTFNISISTLTQAIIFYI